MKKKKMVTEGYRAAKRTLLSLSKDNSISFQRISTRREYMKSHYPHYPTILTKYVT